MMSRSFNATEGGNWKKKFKKALNTPKGLAHIMSVMAEQEKSNQAFVSALLSNQAPAAVPPAAPTTQTAQPTVSSVSLATDETVG